MAGIPAHATTPERAQAAVSWTGAILHAADGQRIPLVGGRELMIKIDSARRRTGLQRLAATEPDPGGNRRQQGRHTASSAGNDDVGLQLRDPRYRARILA
jgi:hypothetical protein